MATAQEYLESIIMQATELQGYTLQLEGSTEDLKVLAEVDSTLDSLLDGLKEGEG